jgi:hypothetical protein
MSGLVAGDRLHLQGAAQQERARARQRPGRRGRRQRLPARPGGPPTTVTALEPPTLRGVSLLLRRRPILAINVPGLVPT